MQQVTSKIISEVRRENLIETGNCEEANKNGGKTKQKVENRDLKEEIGPINNERMFVVKLEKEDLSEYCETKIKCFLDLVQRLISMRSLLGG